MGGLFQILELGKRALMTQQTNLQTIGHNIANVNTPGYTRQRVLISPSFPETTTSGSLGTGVEVQDIVQIRDLFLGQQYREDSKSYGQWQYKEKIYSQIESLISEPNDNTLSDTLNDFWDSWSDLSTNSNSTSNRIAIVEQANLLVNSFHEASNQLESLRTSIDNDLVGFTKEINSMTDEIARLNHQIKTSELGGVSANDLRDSRDYLIDELSSYIDVNTIELENGEVRVYVGAMTLVDGADSLKIATAAKNIDGKVQNKLYWEGTSVELTNLNGQLKGMVESRDEIIPGYQEQLDVIARTLIEEVNAIHRDGYGLDGSTGVNFFDTSDMTASGIKINQSVANDPSKIVASASGEEGDNTIALALHDLRNQELLEGNTATLNDYYNGMVGRLGVESQEANSFTANYELLINQIEQSRQSVQGVSIDEETTNLIKAQNAYAAAARVITAMDEALDLVINGMGIVGR